MATGSMVERRCPRRSVGGLDERRGKLERRRGAVRRLCGCAVALHARLRSMGDDRAGRDRLRVGDRPEQAGHRSRRRDLTRRRPDVERGEDRDQAECRALAGGQGLDHGGSEAAGDGLPRRNRDGPAPGAPAKTFLSITRNGGHLVEAEGHREPRRPRIDDRQRHCRGPAPRRAPRLFDLQAAKTVVKRHCTRRKLPHSKKKRRVCTTRRVIPPHAPLTNSVAVTRSRNGGKTWSAPKRIATVVAAGGTAPLLTLGALPAVAVNPSSGRIYVAWADGRFSGGSGREIAVSASSDAGKKWSRPVRASSQVALAAFDPAIAVGAGGAVAVTYDDLRTWDGTSTDHLPAEVWATVSRDRGATFGGEQLLAGPFDLTTAPFSATLARAAPTSSATTRDSRPPARASPPSTRPQPRRDSRIRPTSSQRPSRREARGVGFGRHGL